MTNDALNEKLAEWAGIKVLGISPAGEPKCSLWGEIDMTGFALYPNDDTARRLCDFTSSLDACFRWLVPKLLASKWKLSLSWSGIPPGKPACHISCWDAKYSKQTQPHISVVAETPALAVCMAIEQIIGGR